MRGATLAVNRMQSEIFTFLNFYVFIRWYSQKTALSTFCRSVALRRWVLLFPVGQPSYFHFLFLFLGENLLQLLKIFRLLGTHNASPHGPFGGTAKTGHFIGGSTSGIDKNDTVFTRKSPAKTLQQEHATKKRVRNTHKHTKRSQWLAPVHTLSFLWL